MKPHLVTALLCSFLGCGGSEQAAVGTGAEFPAGITGDDLYSAFADATLPNFGRLVTAPRSTDLGVRQDTVGVKNTADTADCSPDSRIRGGKV